MSMQKKLLLFNSQKYLNKSLTNYHQCEFKALLHRFPVNLVGQISESHIACRVRKLTRKQKLSINEIPFPLKS